MYNIIGSKNGEKIECSAVLEENKLNVVPKKISVCDCYFDFGLQKTNWENVYHKVTEIMNLTTSCCFQKILLFVVKKVSLLIYPHMLANKILW